MTKRTKAKETVKAAIEETLQMEPVTEVEPEVPVVVEEPPKRPRRETGGTALKRRRTYRKPMVPDNTPNQNRVCVLTGASGLLGSEFIKQCSIDYKIIAIHHNNEVSPPHTLIDPLYPSFPIENPDVITLRADLSNPVEVTELCAHIVTKYRKVDLLINAACFRDFKPLFDDNALQHIQYSFAVNTIAPIQMAVEFCNRFWSLAGWEANVDANRNIVNISSTAGTFVYPDQGQAIYASTKAALNFAGHHLATELWDYGVRVNTIAPNTFPGIVSTKQVIDAIIQCDKSQDTGQHIVIDKT